MLLIIIYTLYSLSNLMDIFSRKAYAEPIKRKTPEDVLAQLKKNFELSGSPNIIASDNGSEWKGVVAKFLKEKKIVHRTNEVGDHHVLGVILSDSLKLAL